MGVSGWLSIVTLPNYEGWPARPIPIVLCTNEQVKGGGNNPCDINNFVSDIDGFIAMILM